MWTFIAIHVAIHSCTNSDQSVLPIIYPFKQTHITEFENSKISLPAEGIVASVMKIDQ